MRGTILLVEDEHLSAIGMADKLFDSGYQVIQGYPILQKGETQFKEMLETYIRAKKIQLVLMDIRLGKKHNGINLARDYLVRHDLPVVYITAFHDLQTFSDARDTEPYGYVIKPCSDAQLLSQVELAMYLARSRKFKDAGFRHDSLHDELTGLPNRKVLMNEMRYLMNNLPGLVGTFALIFADLDKFKEINAEFGHLVGDNLLREVAKRFQNAVKKSDLVVRFGGDEFVFLIKGLDTPTQIHTIAQRIIDSLREPITLESHSIQACASLGIALQESDSSDPLLLLKQADTAMYEAKNNPRLRYSIFKDGDESRSFARLKIEDELKKVIHEAGLTLAFRPILSNTEPRMFGLDLGINWNRHNFHLLTEAECNETAERMGLTIPMTVKLLYAVAALLEVWHRKRLKNIFINIHLGERFIELKEWDKLILMALNQKRLNKKNIGFEVEEASYFRKADKNAVAFANLLSLEFSMILTLESFEQAAEKIAKLPLSFVKVHRKILPMNGSLEKFSAYCKVLEKAGKGVIVDGFSRAEVHARLPDIKYYSLQKALPLHTIEALAFNSADS